MAPERPGGGKYSTKKQPGGPRISPPGKDGQNDEAASPAEGRRDVLGAREGEFPTFLLEELLTDLISLLRGIPVDTTDVSW